ncbi:MAG: DUF4238 domain-containing protein [Armatimonadota bacterium]|nr:DUF4238 domain-containing protein [Armatimonadota bacterium]
MPEFKNQHYLPQFYLKNFTRPEALGQVFVLKKGHSHWSKRGVKSVASRDYFYSFRDERGDVDYTLEQAISELEHQLSPVLVKLLKSASLGRFELNDEEHVRFAQFLMTMWNRVPVQVESSQRWRSELERAYFRVAHRFYAEHPEALERLKEERRRDPNRKNIDEARPEHFDPAHIEITVDPYPVKVDLLMNALDLAEEVLQMDWFFLHSRAPHFFITSDHPFCLVDPTNRSGDFGTGLRHRHAEITLPLSRDVAFFARWENPSNNSVARRWLPALEDTVEAINRRTASQAKNELIASTTTFPGVEEIKARFLEDQEA